MKILFVCMRNVARSQMAEAIWNKVRGKKEAESAGVNFLDIDGEKELKDRSEQTTKAMKEMGVDISKNRSKLLTRKMVEEADKVIVMISKEDCPKYLIENKKVEFWNVGEPGGKGKTLEDKRKARDKIKEKILLLVKEIA